MHGRGGRRVQARAGEAEFTTLSKDGKAVWEPGLPAEVTSRRVHKPVRRDLPDEAAVSCDLKNVLKLPAGAKADWLDKALKAMPSGRAKVQDVFNIVTHPKFVSGVPVRFGRRMLRSVGESLDAFSDKQRTTLVAKCKLAELFQSSALGGEDDEDEDDLEDEPEDRADAAREAMAQEDDGLRPPLQQQRGGGRDRRPSPSAEGRVARFRELRGHCGGSGGARRSPSLPSGGCGGAVARPRTEGQASTGSKAPADGKREEPRPVKHMEKDRDLSPEDRTRMDPASTERQRQQEEARRKLELDRKDLEERERKRKAKLGSAFLISGEVEEEDDDEAATSLVLKRKEPERRSGELGMAPLPLQQAVERQLRGMPGVAIGQTQDPRFVHAMGGNGILAEAHKILQDAISTGRVGAALDPRRHRSRSRSRHRGGGVNVRSTGSYRSPTPDGKARGQARAARKAKMIASMLGLGFPRA